LEYIVKIFNRVLRTTGWAVFLLGSTAVVFALTQKPRSVLEFYNAMARVDYLYLLLTFIAAMIVAWAIDLWVHQET
jgi:hypothetical protein